MKVIALLNSIVFITLALLNIIMNSPLTGDSLIRHYGMLCIIFINTAVFIILAELKK